MFARVTRSQRKRNAEQQIKSVDETMLSAAIPIPIATPVEMDVEELKTTLLLPQKILSTAKDISNPPATAVVVVTTPSKASKPTPIKRNKRKVLTKTPRGRKTHFALSSANKKIKTPLGKAKSTSPSTEADEKTAFVQHEVSCVYKIIRKHTGALGGNAAGGAIYGEVTQMSFQRIVDFLKSECDFNSSSRFIDIGSGLGKPNFHAAIDPGCELSYGVELEVLRWQLSLHNLKSVLKSEIFKSKPNKVAFTAGDITDAKTFDPFTHVYSFDVGFPPTVMEYMANMFNSSSAANYLVSYHHPRKIEAYGYDVNNIGRVSTSMSGSSEGHTCYVYRRNKMLKKTNSKNVDLAFQQGVDLVKGGNDMMLEWIANVTGENDAAGSRTRRRARQERCDRTKRSRESLTQTSMASFCTSVPKLMK